jgi:hypothetical protein
MVINPQHNVEEQLAKHKRNGTPHSLSLGLLLCQFPLGMMEVEELTKQQFLIRCRSLL